MGSGGREGVTGSAVCIGSTPGEKVQEKVRKKVLLALDLEEGSRRRDAGSVSLCLCSRRWFFSFGREGERSRKELLVLFLRMGQASGSWRRVSGGKEFGKVPMSVTWRFFFLFGREEERGLVRCFCERVKLLGPGDRHLGVRSLSYWSYSYG